MATRRSRIKGIANIPQRRKAEVKSTEETIKTDLLQKPTDVNTDASNLLDNSTKDDATTVKTSQDTNQSLNNLTVTNQAEEMETTDNTPKTPVVINNVTEQSLTNKVAINTTAITSSNCVKTDLVIPQRRTFIKPLVNSKVLSQKIRPKPDNSNKSEQTQSESDSETQTPSKEEGTSNAKINVDSDNASESNSTKLVNRMRIKAVPRLGQRRASTSVYGSASESEDDSKKVNKRIRTESVCSVVSTTNEPVTRTDPDTPQKRDNSVVKRKCKRSELSRRMAEARRNFLHKNGKPTDKQKLTMFDLIVYNPDTAPMSQKSKKPETQNVTENLTSSENSRQNDSPAESDDEDSIPAPQIKIGANGEIVVDEQSLIIENSQTKKSRENIQKSALIDGDTDTRYGFFIKEKRSLDWSNEDTVRFYKALNTLGTDFGTMKQLFFERSRRELKKKFKKEEKVNRRLIEKALRSPAEFNIRELKKEADEIEKKAEREKLKKARLEAEWAAKEKEKPIPYICGAAKRKLRAPIQGVHRKIVKKGSDLYGKLVKGITSIWESGESESEDENEARNEAEDEDESEHENEDSQTTAEDSMRNILKPTRCGRIPKPTKIFDYRSTTTVSKPEANLDNMNDKLEPGSIMIIYKESPTGQPAFDVFMVTPNQNKVPITLGSDLVNDITQLVDNSDVPLEENNYTIVHTDESGETANKITEYRGKEVNNVINKANENVQIQDGGSGDNGEVLINSKASEACQQENIDVDSNNKT